VADAAGLVDPARVLWGFALRAYLDDPVRVPHIVFWERERWRGFPGYGWLFPGVGGRANLGLGLGVLADRSAGSEAARCFDAFVADMRRLSVLDGADESISPRLGGWLKMGMVGTIPARGRVLLCGDAAGLVNPLQGEGISQAMGSARAAAEAVLADPVRPAHAYRAFLAATYGPFQSVSAAVHGTLLPRPRAVAVVARTLTAPAVGGAVAGGWSIFWNDLLVGARPRGARKLAALALQTGSALTSRGRTRRWFSELASGAALPSTETHPRARRSPGMVIKSESVRRASRG
jgi:hypothetical protein